MMFGSRQKSVFVSFFFAESPNIAELIPYYY